MFLNIVEGPARIPVRKHTVRYSKLRTHRE